MRKIAAHFWFRPDGTLGKYPIITFDAFNNIVEIRERAQFQEEAGLELVNGLLLPGFIDVVPNSIFKDGDQFVKKYLNRQFVHGSKLLGVSLEFINHISTLFFKGIEFVPCSLSLLIDTNYHTAFEKVIAAKNHSQHALLKLTIENACKLGVDNKWGSLAVGKQPGLLAVSNLNYNNLVFSDNAKLKHIL